MGTPKLRLIPLFLQVLVAQLVMAQGGCPNAGFETGTFTGWFGRTGWCCPINMTTNGIVNGRHTIMSGTGTDSYTDNVVPVVAPGGGAYSVRLGNEEVDSEAEQLYYTMTVDLDNALFVYRYAVVFEDPFHDPSEQPRFEIRMFDQAGASIDCGSYSVTSSAGIEGFVETVDWEGDVVRYKNWTTVAMDLSSYIGEQVTLEFSTGDCSLGAHFGYAYMDCECSPLAISSEFCPGEPVSILQAPAGFAQYLWSTGDTTQTISLATPTTGMVISCTITSVTGCQVTLTSTLEPNIVEAAFTMTGECGNDIALFDASVVTAGSPVDQWAWDFGNGITGTGQSPTPEFLAAGPHVVTLIVTTIAGCSDTASMTIDVLGVPVAALSAEGECQFQDVVFTDQSVPVTGIAQHTWSLGDGDPFIGPGTVVHQYATPGSYPVQLIVVDANGCSDTTETVVDILPITLADLGPDQFLCPVDTVVLSTSGADTYLWSTGETTAEITVTSTGAVWVAQSLAQCTDADTIAIVPAPDPGPLDLSAELCPGRPMSVTIPYADGQYAWDTGDTTRTIIVSGTESHSYTLIDLYGCTYQGLVEAVFDPLDLGVTVPNVITPNGDGKNEFFEPLTGGSMEVEVSIYGRFGDLLFTSRNLSRLWDGSRNDQTVPDGTYFYLVTYQSQCMEAPVELRGAVTVLR